jgi:hypothetical protein
LDTVVGCPLSYWIECDCIHRYLAMASLSQEFGQMLRDCFDLQSSMIDMLARANEWIETENQKINVRLIHSIPKNYRTLPEERRKHQRHLIRRSREASCHCISICSSGLLLARLPLHSIQILSITSPESFHKIMPSNIKTWTTAGNTKLEFASIIFPRLTHGSLLFFPPLLCLFLS